MNRVPDADALLEHLESLLGRFDEHESETEETFAVLAFGEDGARSFATFGLSRHVLERNTALELVLATTEWSFAHGVLRALGDHVLDTHRPLTHGERHRIPGWSPGSSIEGVIAVDDDDLVPFGDVRFARLLPITGAEATFAREHGTAALLERLADVEWTNVFRQSAV